MNNYENMSAADLRLIAREYNMPGAWKANKSQMIAWLEENVHETEEPETIEETTEEIETVDEINEIEEEEIDEETLEEIEEEEPQIEEEEEINDEPETVEIKPAQKGHAAPKRGALIEFNGKEQNICAWGKELGISANTLYGRIYNMGWTIEEAFTTPAGARRQKKKDQGEA